jgi:hypothetical protein
MIGIHPAILPTRAQGAGRDRRIPRIAGPTGPHAGGGPVGGPAGSGLRLTRGPEGDLGNHEMTPLALLVHRQPGQTKAQRRHTWARAGRSAAAGSDPTASASPPVFSQRDPSWSSTGRTPLRRAGSSRSGTRIWVTVQGSRVTSAQERIGPQESFSGASVDHTDARNDILGCFGRSDRSAQGYPTCSCCGRHRARRGIATAPPYCPFLRVTETAAIHTVPGRSPSMKWSTLVAARFLAWNSIWKGQRSIRPTQVRRSIPDSMQES